MLPRDPLESAFAKLDRANKHLTDLVHLAEGFRASQPFQTVHEHDEQSDEWLTYARLDQAAPPEMSLVVGDLAHALRSALDHAVYGLSAAARGGDLRRDEARMTSFPVCDTKAAWQQAVLGPLRFVPQAQLALIEAAQPLRWPDAHAQRNHPLRVITDVDNVDKHRTLVLTATLIELFGVGVSGPAEGTHRFTGRVDDRSSIVSRVPATVDPGLHTQPMWQVRIGLDPAGPLDNPVLFNGDIDHLAVGWVRHVTAILHALRVRPEMAG